MSFRNSDVDDNSVVGCCNYCKWNGNKQEDITEALVKVVVKCQVSETSQIVMTELSTK